MDSSPREFSNNNFLQYSSLTFSLKRSLIEQDQTQATTIQALSEVCIAGIDNLATSCHVYYSRPSARGRVSSQDQLMLNAGVLAYTLFSFFVCLNDMIYSSYVTIIPCQWGPVRETKGLNLCDECSSPWKRLNRSWDEISTYACMRRSGENSHVLLLFFCYQVPEKA